jgi:hypothetical protein
VCTREKSSKFNGEHFGENFSFEKKPTNNFWVDFLYVSAQVEHSQKTSNERGGGKSATFLELDAALTRTKRVGAGGI